MTIATILLRGRWQANQLQVKHSQDLWATPPDLAAAVDDLWNAACAAKGKNLFDGPMARLDAVQSNPALLRFRLSRTSYKPFFAFHLNTSLRNTAATPDPADFPNPLGVSVILESADRQLIFGRRSGAVAYYPRRVHPFAGSMEPTEATPFDTAYRELAEEVHVAHDTIASMELLGIIQDPTLLQPEAVIHARTTLTHAQIEAGLDPHEHDAVVALAKWLPEHEKAAEDILLRDMTPVCLGALQLWSAQQSPR